MWYLDKGAGSGRDRREKIPETYIPQLLCPKKQAKFVSQVIV